MDQEFMVYFDARFQQIAGIQEEARREIASLREETSHRFEQIDSRLLKMEETGCCALAIIEELRHEMHLIAEGAVVLDDRLRHFHREASLDFDQVKGEIKPYYENLNGRQAIVERWADRQHADVMDAIRKLLNPSPLQPTTPSE